MRRLSAPYRIMIVDDSTVVRGLLKRSIEADPELSVVASVGDGQMALNAVRRHDVEVAILDIEMPVMDGLTALPKLIAAKPGIRVLIASTVTRRGADVSLRALAAGAADYVTKPGSAAMITADEFKRELIGKLKVLAHAHRSAQGEAQPTAAQVSDAHPPAAPVRRGGDIRLRPQGSEPPEILAIGSSTGGPQALFRLLKDLALLQQPILITQHMPATFTTILAEHIQRIAGRPAAEAVDGAVIEPGQIYLAPGDFHMVVESDGTRRRIRINKEPPENFCRPAVDPMLRSIARAYGKRALCAILTGMGQDGLRGGEAVVAAGGTMIAQDEKTSIVWGMPGAVATAGLCSAVLPLEEIGATIMRLAGRRAP